MGDVCINPRLIFVSDGRPTDFTTIASCDDCPEIETENVIISCIVSFYNNYDIVLQSLDAETLLTMTVIISTGQTPFTGPSSNHWKSRFLYNSRILQCKFTHLNYINVLLHVTCYNNNQVNLNAKLCLINDWTTADTTLKLY